MPLTLTMNLALTGFFGQGVNDTGGSETPDTENPFIVSFSPPDNDTGVLLGQAFSATYNENIQFGTGNITLRKNDTGFANFAVYDVTTDTGRVSISGNVLTVTPASALDAETEYAIQIDATAIDDTGPAVPNSFAGIADDTTWSWTTTPVDVTGPTILTTNPSDNAVDVPLASTITVTFSENIGTDTGDIILRKNDTGFANHEVYGVGDTGNISISGAVLTITPDVTLDSGTEYAIQITANAIADTGPAVPNYFAGVSDDTTISFTTFFDTGNLDTTKPLFNSSSYDTGTTTLSASVTELFPNTMYWVGVANPSSPDTGEIIAGAGGGILAAGSFIYDTGGNSQIVEITDTSVDEIHLVATDDTGNRSLIEIITGVVIPPAASAAPTFTVLTNYDSNATDSGQHTSANFTPDGGKNLLIMVWSRNDNLATGAGVLDALELNGGSITGNIVDALRYSGYSTGNGRNCFISAFVPAASVSAVSQNVFVQMDNTHRNVRIWVAELSGDTGVGNSDFTLGTSAGLSQTASISATTANSLVLYAGGFDSATQTDGTITDTGGVIINSAESSTFQLLTQEDLVNAGDSGLETFTRASDAQRNFAYAIEIKAAT